MKNTFKKIAASIMAVTSLVVGVTGMSASAATPVSEYNTAYGTLTGRIDVSGTTTVKFTTTTTNPAYKICVSGNVVNYYTGEIKASNSKTDYNKSSVSASITWPFYIGVQVSAFGSHEAYTESGNGWVVYTSLINFTI